MVIKQGRAGDFLQNHKVCMCMCVFGGWGHNRLTYPSDRNYMREGGQKDINCVYCGMSHWHDQCQKFKTLRQRKPQIKGRCYVCLSTQHLFRQCKSEKPCFYCRKKGNHHSSLCPGQFGDQQLIESEATTPTQENLAPFKTSES